MTSSTARSSFSKRLAATCAVLGLATIGIAAAPKPANAWWYNHGYGWGVGVYVPPVVVAPAPAYYAPPASTTPRQLTSGSRRITRMATTSPAIGADAVMRFIRAMRALSSSGSYVVPLGGTISLEVVAMRQILTAAAVAAGLIALWAVVVPLTAKPAPAQADQSTASS